MATPNDDITRVIPDDITRVIPPDDVERRRAEITAGWHRADPGYMTVGDFKFGIRTMLFDVPLGLFFGFLDFIQHPFQTIFSSAPPGIDNRMNDPLWVLYDSQGRVVRDNLRVPPPPPGYRYTGPGYRRYPHRGTDSDGSGMS